MDAEVSSLVACCLRRRLQEVLLITWERPLRVAIEMIRDMNMILIATSKAQLVCH